MILFSTELSVNDSLTKERFIELVIEWNQGSPHLSNIIPNIDWNGERNIRFGDKKLWLDIQEYRNKNIIAIRFEKIEGGVVWDTDYVVDFNDMKISIVLNRSFTDNVEKIDHRFSTPYFIALLIRKGFLKSDNGLEIGETPIRLTNQNLKSVSEVINGVSDYKLPIVYVSKTAINTDPINTIGLSKKLKGIAHVIVQDSVKQNSQLRDLCNGNNEYLGAIGIYYPNRILPSKKFIYRSSRDSNKLFGKVISSVMNYNNIQLIDDLRTWQGVNNALLSDKVKGQKEKRKQTLKDAEIETRELYDLLQEYDDKVQDLVVQNRNLSYENQNLKLMGSNTGEPLIYSGDEDDFFPNEIREIIISALKNELGNMPKDSRRYAVISDILESNNHDNELEKRSRKIKQLLSSYTGMNAKLKNSLKELGFGERQ